MTPYWILLLFPVLASIAPMRAVGSARILGYYLFGLFAILLIGLRYEVGADWDPYLAYFDLAESLPLVESMALNDPGYMALNWFCAKVGVGIWGVNTFGAAVLIYGLVRLASQQPFPWVALTVATPFFIIVVGMGYSRQAIALGFVFLALSNLCLHKYLRFSILIIIAAAFHEGAVIMLVSFLFVKEIGVLKKTITSLIIASIVLALCFLSRSIEQQIYMYIITNNVVSSGAGIRVVIHSLTSCLMLLMHKKYSKYSDCAIWFGLSMLGMLFAPFVIKYSTLVDRIVIYLAPAQIVALARLPVFFSMRLMRTVIVLTIVAIYLVVMFVWLNFSSNSNYWVPYRFILFHE